MTTLLHIDASARVTRSLSRKLSRDFIDTWKRRQPDDTIIRRDIGLNPPPATTEAWIAAVFADPAARTAQQRETIALSDTLIDELDRADIIVLGTPMYNYGMPTSLKGWVDQVVRIGKTFTFDLARGDFPLEPIMSGKKMVLLTSAGEFGFAPGGVRAEMNNLIPHIRTIQHYLGVSECHHVAIEYQEFADARHEESIASAHAALPALVDQLIS